MVFNKVATVLSLATLGLVAACGQAETEAPASTESAADAAPAAAAIVVDEAPALPRTASAPGASVFFITPKDGDTVSSPVTVEFGIEGMTVAPAGVNEQYTGHHHLLVDTGLPPLGQPVPADANHIHFGDGSTSTELTLDPGQHTLLLLLGDHLHIPHEPPVSSPTITITVE
jgi:hypothetical protein